MRGKARSMETTQRGYGTGRDAINTNCNSAYNELMRPYQRIISVALLLTILLAVFEFTHLRGQINLVFLQQEIQAHRLGGLVLFIVLFALGNLIQVPGWMFLAAAVLALGKTTGGIITYVAAVISCCVTFFTIRFVGKDALQQLNNKTALKIMSKLHAHPIRSIALLRVMFQTMPAFNYALAMSGIKFRKYLAGTLLGLPLPIALYCLFFDSLAHVLRLV